MPRLSTGLRGLNGEYEDYLATVYGAPQGSATGNDPSFYATGVATAAAGAKVPGCPANADSYQTQQNGYCADVQGWPLRADGSVLTRQDIEASAQNKFLKDNWPYAAGALLFILWAFGGGGGRR